MQAHIVPRFHLGLFAQPPGRDGFVYSIDKRTGRSARIPVKKACTAEDFYVIEDHAGNPDAVLEDMLQKIESYSAHRIESLVTRPGVVPSRDDQLTLAVYLMLTRMRTPRAREHLRWMTNAVTTAQFRGTLEAAPPWERMRAAVFPEMTGEEAEAFRVRMLNMLDPGDAEVGFPDRHYTVAPMSYVKEQAELAAENMTWTVMRAPAGSEFVIGDHAVTMYDPTVSGERSRRGNALASSAYAETVLAFAPSVAVKLSFGSHEWRDEEVDAAVVNEMNLRTYACAEQEIYGSSQALVVSVWEDARRSGD